MTLDVKKTPKGTLLSSNQKTSSDSEEEDDEESYRQRKIKLPAFLSDLTEEKLKSIIELLLNPMRENLKDFNFLLQETKSNMTHI